MNKEKLTIDDILQSVPGCIYWKDINGVYLGCNQTEVDVLGIGSSKDMIGKTDYDFSWKSLADTLRETDRRIQQTGIPEEIIETPTLANGNILTMLTRKSPLYDKEKNIIGIIGISVDITNRETKEELKNQLKTQSYINNILQYVPGCIYWKDINGVYLGCNQMEADILGFSCPQEVIGKTDYDFSWKSAADTLRETDKRIMQTKIQKEITERVTFADGKMAVMLTRKSPLYDEKDNVIGIVGVSIDRSDYKKAEELENKLKVHKELYKIAEDVAHDIVSPIAAFGAFEYLVREKLSEKEKKVLNSCINGVTSIASSLIDKYKRIKTYEVGKTKEVESKEEKFELNTVINKLIEVKKYEYNRTKVEIKYEEKEGKEIFIKGNEVDFWRMMSNLINNGIEAVEGKKAEVELRYIEKGEKVEIRVKDNGVGMEKEMAEKMKKGILIGTTKKDGHGIGTQQIISTIKAMNGQIEIESKKNIGTEFILTFKQVQK